ncbi:hypothetical protein IJX73_02220 [bacterium]|nr:hypothetical protein [bacterium]
MKKINVANELNAYTIIPLINSFENFIHNEEKVEVELNFNDTNFTCPGGLTPLLAYLKENENTEHDIYINSQESKVDLYIKRMGFYDILGLDDEYQYTKHSSTGKFQEPYFFSKDTDPNIVTEKSSNIIKIFSKRRMQNYNEAIGWCIDEIIDNAQNHSNSIINVIMAQKFSNINTTEFCVADRGIGIRESMGEDNIKIALEKCITKAKGKKSKGCGNGLFYTAELIKRDTTGKCSMTIWSEDHILILHSNSEPIVKKVEGYWQGVNIAISMYNGISVSLTELMKNIDNHDYSFSLENMPEYYESLFEN